MLKIIYAIGKEYSGVLQLRRFLQAIDFPCEIKIAAHLHHLPYLSRIDWVMDAIYNRTQVIVWEDFHNLFGKRELYQNLNFHACKTLLEAIEEFQPDLVLGDGEYLVIHCADWLGIPFWYLGGSLLSLGAADMTQHKVFKQIFNWSSYNEKLIRMPTPEKYIVPNPFPILDSFTSRRQIEMCSPYYLEAKATEKSGYGIIAVLGEREQIIRKIAKSIELEVEMGGDLVENYQDLLGGADWMITSGESCYLADALYNGIERVFVVPVLKDPENHFNSIIYQRDYHSPYLGELEKAESEAPDLLREAFEVKWRSEFNEEPGKMLHEIIKERFGIN